MHAPLALSEGIRVSIQGAVQGVGFRPFIVRLAQQLGVTGRVWNSDSGVEIEAQASSADLQRFVGDIQSQAPMASRIDSIHYQSCIPVGIETDFYVVASDENYIVASVPADKAVCRHCLDEINNPDDTRYGYLFNSCAECGPRFSMINAMPYDRPYTAMSAFPLCNQCDNEFNSFDDRRFHIEGISCPECGPRISLETTSGQGYEGSQTDLLTDACNLLSEGKLLAIKGIGGFHICCDGLSRDAINRLRLKKYRPAKPFALMMRDIEMVEQFFCLSALEKELLSSPQAPIVLLSKNNLIKPLPESLAPGVAHLGVMLAYSPMHALLLSQFAGPLVMTSGNQKSAPLCIDNHKARENLADIVDGFLFHNRDIVHRSDDSLVRIIDDTPRLIRRARGYAPEGLTVNNLSNPRPVIAMGGDIKNTFALCHGKFILPSGHNGDLSQPGCFNQTRSEIEDYCELFNARPEAIVVDRHPDYFSSRLGQQLAKQHNVPVLEVQHHHAHHAACLADNNLTPDSPVMGIILDGLGYGDDGTIWGGELLLADFTQSKRLACLKPFPLLGNDKANRQPWRNALAQLSQAGLLERAAESALPAELSAKLNSNDAQVLINNSGLFPVTSSAGRLFDAVAAMLGLCVNEQSYEGEAACRLEALALQAGNDISMPAQLFEIVETHGHCQLDPSRFWRCFIEALNHKQDKGVIAKWFHHCFVDSWVALAKSTLSSCPDMSTDIVLSGGVFQNALVLERMKQQLEAIGFNVFTHQRVPSNDAGIALGQAAIAQARMAADSLLENETCV